MADVSSHDAPIQTRTDAAAMHPSLREGRDGYYRACAAERTQLKRLLAVELDLDHDLYLLNNTTHGLLTARLGLSFDGYDLTAIDGCYGPYKVLHGPADGERQGRALPLVTHIEPETGRIHFPPVDTAMPVVFDAAQSFATAGFHRDAISSDVFICPLHKHAGLARGLGLLAIEPTADLPHLRSLALMAEGGTVDLCVVEQAHARARKLRDRLVNRFAVRMLHSHRDALLEIGIRVLSPLNAPLPFVVLQGMDVVLMARELAGSPFTVKHNDTTGISRISGAVRGCLGDEPIDFADRLSEQLLQSKVSRVE